MRNVRRDHLLAVGGCVCLVVFVIAGAVEGWQADTELRSGQWTALMWVFLGLGVLQLVVALALRLKRR